MTTTGDSLDAPALAARVAALEQSERDARSRLLHAEKMAALGRMAGGIAHEISNPISVIQGNAEQIRALARGKHDPEALLAVADRIEGTVQRIAKIVRGLRVFTRDGDDDPLVIVPLTELIDDTLAICEARFRVAGVQLQIAPPPRPLLLRCRPVPVSQVLLNLLNNAVDAVAELPERWVRLEAQVAGERARISVTDSGRGIPEQVREKLMQPYFTTKAVDGGMGLGLSLSRRIVESHGGSLALDAGSERTRFVLELPLARS